MEHRINDTATGRVFDVLQISGAAGFLLIVLTAILSRHIQRHFTWLNFCISWIISCVSYTLLVFTGTNGSKHVPYALCVTQAALIYGAPVLTGGTTFSLAFYMYTHVKASLDHTSLGVDTFWLILGPYLIGLGFFLGVLVSGIRQPSQVHKAQNYCDLTSPFPYDPYAAILVIVLKGRYRSKAAALVVALAATGVVLISVFVAVQLYRNRRRLGHGTLHVAAAIRVICFGIVGFLGFVISAVYVITWNQGPGFDIILALVPNFGVVIFGSQADILHAWIALLRGR
ncbi:hypothetical protein ARMGADRAFT_1059684 [Armillaria gallica]|uniref:G-protein coupled receptors family 3 profile domain-containing protein n=1 Tax=Armillaria gallica TaxID=47427 RepID=A0A2H3E795_ARMGA|nr:hypothetical protein ARMGADRAFT_1059684 [Armillaria gallica]